MTDPAASTPAERRQFIWQRVHHQLLKHAKSDSRFHFDFLSFTPDFHGSSYAVDRLVQLPGYQAATTLLVTPDNSLEQLRHRALSDGKKVLVGTYRLRRGFVLLIPSRISDENRDLACTLDGMERQGVGRHLSLAQMQEEAIHVDLCVLGGLVFNTEGVVIWEGHGLFEVQWALLHDMKVLEKQTPVIGVAHQCQVVSEEEHGMEKFRADKTAEVQCDFVITPERTIEVHGAVKPKSGIQFDALDPQALDNIPPLQELKGIHTMEHIMQAGGCGRDKGEVGGTKPSADEQLGVSMAEKIMKRLKV